MNISNKPVKSALLISIKSFIITFLIFSLTPTAAESAKVALTPEEYGVAIKQGEEREITISSSFYEISRRGSFVNFSIKSSGRNIPNSWITNHNQVTLDTSQTTKDVSFIIKVPADAMTGLHRDTLIPVVSRSSERVSVDNLTLYVEVLPLSTCEEPPTISNITSNQRTVSDRNNKQLTLVFSGAINSSPGCTTQKAWYKFSDEYGEMDKTGTVKLGENGNFTVSVQVIASRKGDDKDGRLYSVIFGAENEYGKASGGRQKVVIKHDNRKK